ncbi:GNAT family N-acetyltransferase [Thermodesulfobacteriota bacterium]
MSEKWDFHWLTSWNEIWSSSFVRQWQSWINQSPDAHVFFEPSLVRAWFETYKDLRTIDPCFLIARSREDNIVFFPLVFDRGGWREAWQLSLIPVGHTDFDYHYPILTNRTEPNLLANFWTEFFIQVEKKLLRSVDMVFINGLHQKFISNIDMFYESDVSPYINLKSINSVDRFIGTLSRRTREDVRRKKRRLEKLGRLHFRIYSSQEIEEALAILPTILAEHSKKWPNSYKAPYFHENIIRNGLEAGILHMSELLLGDKAISWHIGFSHKSIFYWYLPVYKPKFSLYSPGQTHLIFCIEEAINKGSDIFDFLRGDEGYKKKFANEFYGLFEIKKTSGRIKSYFRSVFINSIKPLLRKFLFLD